MLIELILVLVMAAAFGAVFGSFANVIAIRTHESSTLLGRSHCTDCKKPLKPRHLVPVLSWVLLHGKCAHCGKKISIQYPLVELGGAILAVLAVGRFWIPGDWSWMLFEFAFGIFLIVFVVMDMRWRELPLELMVGAGIIFSLWHMLMRVAEGTPILTVAWSHALGFSVASFFFLFQWIVSRGRWIGSGDIWLGAVLGAVLGWPLLGLTIYFAYLLGGLVALVLLFSKKIKPGSQVPFAPALVAGSLASIWWGPTIISWITNAVS
jgi:prepilin signal peptidase PulO-like enzyme (type II secretory pathway)